MDLKDIRGVGPKKLEKLKELGIVDIDGLKEYKPVSYEDRSRKILLSQAHDVNKHYFELEITASPKTYFFKKICLLRDLQQETNLLALT